jgi:hypothetical protein
MAIDILSHARRLESSLARSLDGAAKRFANSGERQPLELMSAIVDAVASRLEPAGRGTFVFPFNRIAVAIAADGREKQSRIEAVLRVAPTLEQRIAERIRIAGCDTAGLLVDVSFVPHRGTEWQDPDFHLEFDCVEAVEETSEPAAAAAEHLRLTIVSGSASKPAYDFALRRINLGRCADVRDGRHRLIRTNHVAFIDGAGDPNHTVSRRHAHIIAEERSAHYRVCDDGSAHGTSIVRSGKTIPVPTGARGVRLQNGDEIVLGDARLRVRLVTR